jgi:hypothetical protein
MRIFLALILLCLPAYAATLNVPATYSTVQAAINAAQPGDTVLIAAGVYNETSLRTVRSGTALNRIVIDGQGVATIKQFQFYGHQYITLKNITVKGFTTTSYGIVWFKEGSHWARCENVTVDANWVRDVDGMHWSDNAIHPFGSGTNSATDASSDIVITGCTFQHFYFAHAFHLDGNRNVIEKSHFRDFIRGDAFYLKGQDNIIRDNLFENNLQEPGAGNHADFLQCLGVNGGGLSGMIVERNIIRNYQGGISQFEGNLNPHFNGITIRNNIYIGVTGGGSCSVPGVKYYNNVFYRCNGAPGWGIRLHLSSTNIWTGSPDYPLLASQRDVQSGNLVAGNWYKIWPQNGGASGLSVTYNGRVIKYSGEGTFQAVEGVTTYVESHPTQSIISRALPNRADDGECIGNVFLECGDNPTDYEFGWYNFDYDLTGVRADYNYVAGPGFTPKRQNPNPYEIGGPDEWYAQYWYEPNGINGGDPKFVDFSTYDFRLLAGSPLIDAGDPDIEVLSDFIGTIRPLGAAPDIGAYEYDDGSPPPDPPEPGTPPTAPSALTATALSSTTIGLTWTDNANNEGSFEVDQSPNGSAWTQIATLAANTVSYTSTGLTPSTLYYFRVRASNGDGDSANTSTASATTEAPPVINTPPDAPSGLTVVAIGSSGATISWTDNSDDETGFEIARSLDEVSWVTIVTADANAEQYTNGGLAPALTYYYRLRAVNAYGFSAWSESSATTTAATSPRAPRSPRPAAIGVGTP